MRLVCKNKLRKYGISCKNLLGIVPYKLLALKCS